MRAGAAYAPERNGSVQQPPHRASGCVAALSLQVCVGHLNDDAGWLAGCRKFGGGDGASAGGERARMVRYSEFAVSA